MERVVGASRVGEDPRAHHELRGGERVRRVEACQESERVGGGGEVGSQRGEPAGVAPLRVSHGIDDAGPQRSRLRFLRARALLDGEHVLHGGARPARVLCLLERACRVELGCGGRARGEPGARLHEGPHGEHRLVPASRDVVGQEGQRRVEPVEQRQCRGGLASRQGDACPHVPQLGPSLVALGQGIEGAPRRVPLLASHERRPRRRRRSLRVPHGASRLHLRLRGRRRRSCERRRLRRHLRTRASPQQEEHCQRAPVT